MNFKKRVKSIQTAGYNGARTVYQEKQSGKIGVLVNSIIPKLIS